MTATTCHADAPWRDIAHVRVLENDVLRVRHRTPGDGVIQINGSEVWRAPHSQRPDPETFFDVDLSPRAGQYVFIEFVAEGSVRGASADWNNPRFVTGP